MKKINNDYGNGISNILFEKGIKKNRQLTKTASGVKTKNFKFYSEKKNTFGNLITENYGLKTKINLFETQFKNQNKNDIIILDKNLNRLNNSTAYNNINLNLAFNNLKTNIENYNQNNSSAIVMMNNNEMKKWKDEERKRREKQQLDAIVNNYGHL